MRPSRRINYPGSMLRILIPLGIVGLGLMIYSLIEALQTPRHRVRVMSKAAWLAVILLVPIIGAGLWLGFGRAKSSSGGGTRAGKGPTAPDDDPEFLRQVEFRRRQQQRREEEARKHAEEERKRRSQSADQSQDEHRGEGVSGPEAGPATGGSQNGTPGAERPGHGPAGSGTSGEGASKDTDEEGESPQA